MGSCVHVNKCWGIFRPNVTVFCTFTLKSAPNFAIRFGNYWYLQLSFECIFVELLKLLHFTTVKVIVFVVSFRCLSRSQFHHFTETFFEWSNGKFNNYLFIYFNSTLSIWLVFVFYVASGRFSGTIHSKQCIVSIL